MMVVFLIIIMFGSLLLFKVADYYMDKILIEKYKIITIWIFVPFRYFLKYKGNQDLPLWPLLGSIISVLCFILFMILAFIYYK